MSEIFETEELLEEYEDDHETVLRLLDLFEADCRKRLPLIQAAIAGGDAVVLAAEAHAVKGGSGNFFAVAAFETAQRLESMGQAGECEGAMPVFDRLEADVTALAAAVRRAVQ